MGLPGGGSGCTASDEDDCLRLLLTPFTFGGAALTEELPGSASKHCHAAAHMRSARTGDCDAATLMLAADECASVLFCANAGMSEGFNTTCDARGLGGT